MMTIATYQIGEVAGRTGLSLRTVRHYEAVGLVAPSGRSEGGFRLYTEPDVQRLLLVRAMKPADFSLEELQEVLELRDRVSEGGVDPADHAEVAARFRQMLDLAAERLRVQRERLIAAELAIELLRGAADHIGRPRSEVAEVAE